MLLPSHISNDILHPLLLICKLFLADNTFGSIRIRPFQKPTDFFFFFFFFFFGHKILNFVLLPVLEAIEVPTNCLLGGVAGGEVEWLGERWSGWGRGGVAGGEVEWLGERWSGWGRGGVAGGEVEWLGERWSGWGRGGVAGGEVEWLGEMWSDWGRGGMTGAH